MTSVSTRVLKDKLSSYLHRAENGERILVLRNGRPVAVLASPDELPSRSEASILERLASRGLVELPGGSRQDSFEGPVVDLGGDLASAMVIEDRR